MTRSRVGSEFCNGVLGRDMVLDTSRNEHDLTDDLRECSVTFIYPSLLNHIDVARLARFPKGNLGKPGIDMVDSLRTSVLVTEAERLAGGGRALARNVARAWNLSVDSAERVLRALRSGKQALSASKGKGLIKCHPELREIWDWPWDALHARHLKQRTCFHVAADKNGFWVHLVGWRKALLARSVTDLLISTERLLASLGPVLRHPAVRPKAIEFLDVVDRLLDLMPAELLPLDLTLGLSRVRLMDRDEANKLRSFLGANERTLARRWRHFSLAACVIVLPKRGCSQTVGTTLFPWGFLPESRRRALLDQERNEHIDFFSRLRHIGQ